MSRVDRTTARWQPHPDEARLVAEWAPLAYSIARRYHLPGSGFDDVKQEALIGLLVGIRTYDPARGVPFKAFLGYSVDRWLVNKVKLANRAKHRPLNESARTDDIEGATVVDLLPARDSDPHETCARREQLASIIAATATLTEIERGWLQFVIDGGQFTVDGVKNKQADNAISRARKKLRDAA